MAEDNPWLARRVLNWAHQGGAREGPSNTLWAMRRAMTEAGAHGLEIDVHRTADGVLVVAHDDDLVRMTGAPGRIATSTLEELRRLDAAHNWIPGKVASATAEPGEDWPLRHHGTGPIDPDLRIPTLEEVFDAFPGVPLNIEIKRRPAARPLADLLARTGRDDVIVVSIRPVALWLFRRRARHLARRAARAQAVPLAMGPIGLALFWLASRVGIALPARGHVAVQMPLWFKGRRVTDRRFVHAAHRRGLAVHLWTLDERPDIEKAIDLGADGIMSDRPTQVAKVLVERGVGWRP